MPLARHTSTPPTAFVISMTPPHVTFAANGMFCPLSSDTVLTTHEQTADGERRVDRLLAHGADVVLPSSRVHDGIGIIRSRGNEMTVTRRGSSEMCTSMLTSLSSPSAVGTRAALAEEVGVLRLARVGAGDEEVDAALDRADVGRDRLLALELDGIRR